MPDLLLAPAARLRSSAGGMLSSTGSCLTSAGCKSPVFIPGPSEAVRHGGGRRTKNLQGERERKKREGTKRGERERRGEKGKKGREEQEMY